MKDNRSTELHPNAAPHRLIPCRGRRPFDSLILCTLALTSVLLTFVLTASAANIILAPTVTTNFLEGSSSAELVFSVANNGDEAAHDVAIEAFLLGESIPLTGILQPGSSAEVKKRLTLDQLKIRDSGSYVMPFRVTYKDSNMFPLSAAHAHRIQLPPMPPRAVVISFDDGEGLAEIATTKGKKSELTGRIVNVGQAPVKIDDCYTFSSLEVSVTLEPLKLPLELKPGEEAPFTLTAENIGGLTGSLYANFVVVSGTTEGGRFAEAAVFRSRIEPPGRTSSRFLATVLVGSLVVIAAVGLLRRRKGR